MNDSLTMQKMYTIEKLEHEPPNKVQRKSVVSITFDQFIEVHGHQRKSHTLSDKLGTMR